MNTVLGVVSAVLALVWTVMSVLGIVVAVDERPSGSGDGPEWGILLAVTVALLTAACLWSCAWRCLV